MAAIDDDKFISGYEIDPAKWNKDTIKYRIGTENDDDKYKVIIENPDFVYDSSVNTTTEEPTDEPVEPTNPTNEPVEP